MFNAGQAKEVAAESVVLQGSIEFKFQTLLSKITGLDMKITGLEATAKDQVSQARIIKSMAQRLDSSCFGPST